MFLLLLCPAPNAALAGTMDIDIHDGEPWRAIWDPDRYSATGNYMYDAEGMSTAFKVERIWFYHGGDYPDSGLPYQLHIILRHRDDFGGEDYTSMRVRDRETTCNYCWEEYVIGFNIWDGLNDRYAIGVFIRPVEGTGGSGFFPRLWRDRYTNHDQLAAVMNVWYPPPPTGTPSAEGGRDQYTLWYYNSDYGVGEVLLGMEISSDVITSAGESSFSTIKSLY